MVKLREFSQCLPLCNASVLSRMFISGAPTSWEMPPASPSVPIPMARGQLEGAELLSQLAGRNRTAGRAAGQARHGIYVTFGGVSQYRGDHVKHLCPSIMQQPSILSPLPPALLVSSSRWNPGPLLLPTAHKNPCDLQRHLSRGAVTAIINPEL